MADDTEDERPWTFWRVLGSAVEAVFLIVIAMLCCKACYGVTLW